MHRQPSKTDPELQIPVVRGSAWLQTIQWVIDPLGFMHTCKRYGDVFSAYISGAGHDPLVFVSDPRILSYVFSHDREELMATGDGIAVLEPLLGTTSVVMLEQEKHQSRRKLLMPAFHGDKLQMHAKLIHEISQQEVDRLPLDQSFPALKLTQQITLQVIMQAVFGMQNGDCYNETRRILIEIFDFFSSPAASAFLFFPFLQREWGPWRKFKRLRKRLDDIIFDEIAGRSSRSGGPGIDVLSMLMTSIDEQGQSLTPLELRNELMTILLAGLETTSTVMAWALYWIHRDAAVRNRVIEELDSIQSLTDYTSLCRLPYLSAVCQEVLRIHPPVQFSFARVSQEDLRVEGYYIPKGTRLVACIELLHHREDIYPEPASFRPERFLEKRYASSEFMPFGAGARRCIGEALAMLELKIALATLLKQHSFCLSTRKKEVPQRRGVILSPRNGVPIRVTSRRIGLPDRITSQQPEA